MLYLTYYPVQKTEGYENGQYFLHLFEEIWNDKIKLQDVTDIVMESISTAYRENSPDFIYFYTLYNIFNEFLNDISEDVLPNEADSLLINAKLDTNKSIEEIFRNAQRAFNAWNKLDVSPVLKRVFVEQIKVIYWRNKIAPSTLNVAGMRKAVLSNETTVQTSDREQIRLCPLITGGYNLTIEMETAEAIHSIFSHQYPAL